MPKRDVIKIDEQKCNGCGLCIPNCPEGAIQIIDGKARLISDLFCDGLGACLGHCPEGAISIEKREAEVYNEEKVMKNIIRAGDSTIKAHLKHLIDHNEKDLYERAINVLKSKNIKIPDDSFSNNTYSEGCNGGCPGSQTISIERHSSNPIKTEKLSLESELKNWPIQLKLISPQAGYFKNADLLLAADCTAFSLGMFHNDILKGKTLAICCPKLDSDIDEYIDKLTIIIEKSTISTLTVAIMEVPCCSGLMQIAREAINRSGRKVPIKLLMIGIQGNILRNEWI